MGRPTKYNADVANRICDVLRAGNTRNDAVAYGGITRETFSQWLKKFPDFSDMVTRAEADCAIHFVAAIKKAGTGYDRTETVNRQKTVYETTTTKNADGSVTRSKRPIVVTETDTKTTREFDWRAGESWLKRRRREEWGDATKIEHSGEVKNPLSELTLEELYAIREKRSQR